jgi:antiviral helicase SKI2
MADDLVGALQKVHLKSTDQASDEFIDDILDQCQPRKRIKQDGETLKKELEQKYLTPSPKFSTEWLNKLQQ